MLSMRIKHLPALPVLLLGLAMLLYALTFSYLTVTRYAAFEARALDLGNLHQTVWNTANGRPFQMTNQPGTVNRLSLHVEPILLPIAALYWIHDGPETLLILQSLVVALGAWPLFALTRRRLRNDWLALILALVFLLNPTIQAANWLEFHPVTLAPTLLMAAFYFLVAGQSGWYTLFAILAASCKEEMGLLLFMIGLYGCFVLQRRRLGLLTMVLALGWSLLAVLGIQQIFADGNIHWGRYDYLGATPIDKVFALLSRPDLVWAQLQKADALGYFYRLLWPVGFIALLAPEVLLLALPSLAINLLADFSPMHEVYTLIYAAPMVPFVMLALVEGVRRAQAWRISRTWPAVQTAVIGLFVLGAAIYAQVQHGYLPGGGNYKLYRVSDHDRLAATIIAQIPADAKVSAQDKLDPHVAGRPTIYIFPRIDDADTVFVDVTGPAWPQHPNDLYATVQTLLAGDFGVAAGLDGYLLLRKGLPNKTLPDTFYSAFRDTKPRPLPRWQQPIGNFGEQLNFLDQHVLIDEHGETVVQLRWQRFQQPFAEPITEDYAFYIAYADPDGNILQESTFYPPVATLWYPTSMWRADETVVMQTLPWQLDAAQFTLLVGVYRGESWQSGQRLPLTTGPMPAQIHLENGTLVRLGGYRRMTTGWQPIEFAYADPTQPLQVSFGNAQTLVALYGVTPIRLPTQAGDDLRFQLHWRASRNPIDFDYALFAHVLNDAGEKVAQLDWQPHDALGPRPMTTWFAATELVDPVTIPLPPTLPAGNYRVILGVYNWQSGERLTATADAGSADNVAGDVVTLLHFRLP